MIEQGSLMKLNQLFQEQIDDVLKNVSNEMNSLNLTNNTPPILSTLIKDVSKQIIWLEQSDILKVIIKIF